MESAEPDTGARVVLEWLGELGWTLATAESLTGGLVGGALTAVPGSSGVYVGGVVSYATELKTSMLSVDPGILERDGVVSRACAEAMASGVRDLTGADCAVSTTGVAGPGPQDGVAAGTVWIGIAGPGGVRAELLDLEGSRDEVRRGAVDGTLAVVRDFVFRASP